LSFFSFPDDAHWDEATRAVEFGVAIGEYRGVVRVPRRVFQSLLDSGVTPESCVAAFYLQRSEFERAAENKLRARDLTADGNVELTARDLRLPAPGRGANS